MMSEVVKIEEKSSKLDNPKQGKHVITFAKFIMLFAFITAHLAKHKQLRGGIIRIDQIPKSPSGKILRRILRQEALKEFK